MILKDLPDAVLLEEVEGSPSKDQLRFYYEYFALCDEEIFYRRQGKISGATWRDWERGLHLNLRREIFAAAWVAMRADGRLEGRFADLERSWALISQGLTFDPRPSLRKRLMSRFGTAE